MSRIAHLLLPALACLLPSTAQADVLPPSNGLGSPQETALVIEAGTLVPGLGSDEERLAKLDQILARLTEPTVARGMIQGMRAELLLKMSRDEEARGIVEEAVRLLPGYSGPLMLAAHVYAYSERPELAADYFIRASRITPKLVQALDSYEVGNILMRLRAKGDQNRVLAFSQRLIDINWRGTNVDTRSRMVRDLIKQRVEQGDIVRARALIPELVNPSDFYELLAIKQYKPIWPELVGWAGNRLEKQWAVYLTDQRERWDASRDLAAGRGYLRALATANHNKAIIAEFLPVLSGSVDKDESAELLWMAATMAQALAELGRWEDIETMYSRLEEVWPLGSDTNALNLTANRARYLLFAGKKDQALQMIDASIAEAEKQREEVGGDALSVMHQVRACTLHLLGRTGEAAKSIALGRLTSPEALSGVVNMFLCLDRPVDARQVLLTALRIPYARRDAILILQSSDDTPIQSEYGRRSFKDWAAFRTDPNLLAALKEHGRLLPFSRSAGAPQEVVRSQL
jgi:tetratricopeptide (TPR) repeat protein